MNEEIKEEWRDVVGYEGIYQVSNTGKVRNIKRNKELKASKQNGYPRVILIKNGIGHSFNVHRLVAFAFIPNPKKLPQVDHIDGTRDNNNVLNLRWVDARGNSLNPNTHPKHVETNIKSHCTEEYRERVRSWFKNEEFIKKWRKGMQRIWDNSSNHKRGNERCVKNVETNLTWDSCASLCRFLKVSYGTVTRYCQGKMQCKRTITFENGITISNPHFEYITEEESANV